MKYVCLLATVCTALTMLTAPALAAEKLRALIIDGQNNHGNWPQTTPMMKSRITETSSVCSVCSGVREATTPAPCATASVWATNNPATSLMARR